MGRINQQENSLYEQYLKPELWFIYIYIYIYIIDYK